MFKRNIQQWESLVNMFNLDSSGQAIRPLYAQLIKIIF